MHIYIYMHTHTHTHTHTPSETDIYLTSTSHTFDFAMSELMAARVVYAVSQLGASAMHRLTCRMQEKPPQTQHTSPVPPPLFQLKPASPPFQHSVLLVTLPHFLCLPPYKAYKSQLDASQKSPGVPHDSQNKGQTPSVAVAFRSLSRVQLFATPWTAARQASLSITISLSLLKLMSTESVMPSNHLILCHPLLLLPSIFPSIRVFANESALCIRGPKYWSFTFSISLPKGRRPLRSKVKEMPASLSQASLAPTCQPLSGTLGPLT